MRRGRPPASALSRGAPFVVAPHRFPAGTARCTTLETLQRRYVERVLVRSENNKTAAANILGVDRRTLQRLFAKDSEDESE